MISPTTLSPQIPPSARSKPPVAAAAPQFSGLFSHLKAAQTDETVSSDGKQSPSLGQRLKDGLLRMCRMSARPVRGIAVHAALFFLGWGTLNIPLMGKHFAEGFFGCDSLFFERKYPFFSGPIFRAIQPGEKHRSLVDYFSSSLFKGKTAES